LSSKSNASFIRFSLFVPISFNVPASIPSGRSVVSRRTKTGTPMPGASSCTPPESVKTR
ncbi:conserved hypothetical protein, partial [Listeria marthii FSL S4-120]